VIEHYVKLHELEIAIHKRQVNNYNETHLSNYFTTLLDKNAITFYNSFNFTLNFTIHNVLFIFAFFISFI